MIDEICASLRNYFVAETVAGEFTVEGHRIALPFLSAGQYFRISGSRFNDGVYRYGTVLHADETFSGTVQAMAVPPALEALAAEIEAWREKHADAVQSPYQSESFGGYSYTKSADASWQAVFASRLKRWRKL